MATDHQTPSVSANEPNGQADAVDALRAEIAAIVEGAFVTLRSPKLRGPFPHPTKDDLTRSAPLSALASWLRAAAKRSKQTLGSRGVGVAVQAASNLTLAAELLAIVENAPSPEAALGMASAALKGLALGSGLPVRTR